MNFREYLLHSYYKIYKKDALRLLNKFNNTQWCSKEELKKYQLKKLKNLITYSYKYVPYYKKLFRNIKLTPDDIKSVNDLNKIPILNKGDIKENLKDLVSTEYKKQDLIPDSTGGSTGVNLKFYNDKKRFCYKNAISLRGNEWAGLNLNTKSAYLWGSPIDLALQKSFIGKIYDKMHDILFLSSFNLSDSALEMYTKKLLKHNPHVLISYPTFLYTFSKFMEEKQIELENLNSIITSAETLYDYQRDYIEEIFNCKIFNRYGSREFSAISQECNYHQGMHINIENLIMQFQSIKTGENTDGKELSNIILTDLNNFGMPFIRYKIGDIGKLIDEKCNCGRNLPLINIEGRNVDLIKGTNGQLIGSNFFSILLRTYINGIEKFQVLQKQKNEILINLVINNKFDSEEAKKIKKEINKVCGTNMKIKIKILDNISTESSGKYRFIKCEI